MARDGLPPQLTHLEIGLFIHGGPLLVNVYNRFELTFESEVCRALAAYMPNLECLAFYKERPGDKRRSGRLHGKVPSVPGERWVFTMEGGSRCEHYRPSNVYDTDAFIPRNQFV
jgi:hypothetical protein